MAKKRMHRVNPPKDERILIHIDRFGLKTRKPFAVPATRIHTAATAYRRKPKHPGKELE